MKNFFNIVGRIQDSDFVSVISFKRSCLRKRLLLFLFNIFPGQSFFKFFFFQN